MRLPAPEAGITRAVSSTAVTVSAFAVGEAFVCTVVVIVDVLLLVFASSCGFSILPSLTIEPEAGPVTVRAGAPVDLGLVGAPVRNGAPQLLNDLLSRGYVPIVACIGATRSGQLLNVNADTLASHLAAAIGAKRLVIAGGTSGVLDAEGRTIAKLTRREAAQLVKTGTANKGMVAKLQACRAALQLGVGDVVIAGGREIKLEGLADAKASLAGCTQVVR